MATISATNVNHQQQQQQQQWRQQCARLEHHSCALQLGVIDVIIVERVSDLDTSNNHTHQTTPRTSLLKAATYAMQLLTVRQQELSIWHHHHHHQYPHHYRRHRRTRNSIVPEHGSIPKVNRTGKPVTSNRNGLNRVFGQPFVKRFALSYRIVVCLSCPVCHVCDVGVWPNGSMD